MEVTIGPLRELTDADAIRLLSTYTSPACYRVEKSENDARTTIALQLEELEQPYVKNWDVDLAEVERYRSYINQGLSLGAYAGDTLVGVALGERQDWNRSLLVWEFHIDPAYHHRGIGRRLMDALAEKARQVGLRVMVCETQSTNVSAIRFYRSVGFEIGGIDLSYYTNTDAESGEVAIFMKRKLP